MGMNLRKEIHFETEIYKHPSPTAGFTLRLAQRSTTPGGAVFVEDVLAWVHDTQTNAWKALEKNHGSHGTETLLTGLREQIDQRGTLYCGILSKC